MFHPIFSCINYSPTTLFANASLTPENYYKSIYYYTNFNEQAINKNAIITTIDGHSTSTIIPLTSGNSLLYLISNVMYMEINVHTGIIENKKTVSNFAVEETLLNYYDLITNKRHLILSTTRNTNGIPITVFLRGDHL